MHPFLQQLGHELRRSQLAGKRILLGVSGGADSMALLRGFLEFQIEFRLDLRAAHLNHLLRGIDADNDAEWLRQTCDALQVLVTIGEADVASLARTAGTGLEEAARSARYQFLEQTAVSLAADHIAVAHSADDQAETILHHILRGTGLAGLRGIPQYRDLATGIRLIRPLLSISRAEIRGYLADIGQDFREDASNGDETFTRNRIRRTLLPALAAEYNPNINTALLRLGQQAVEAYAAMEAMAAELLDRASVSPGPHACSLDCSLLTGRPRHLIREAFTLIWRRQDWPRQKMTFDHWDQLVEIGLHGGAATFPGIIDARRTGDVMHLTRAGNP